VLWAERLRLDEEDRNQKMALTKTEHSEITESQVLALLGSVSYQDGSVVSRVILKRDKGSVTVFAFDEGQGLSEHTSPFEALVQGIEGRGEVIIAGKPLTLGEGEILLSPAQRPHAVKATSRFRMMLTRIRP
jgi:quercetin dioxygenase-like cupin family protein